MIDRTKNIFKLNQGTYIAPERLEDIYMGSPWLTQIFVDGISTEATVVAIVVPAEAYVRKNFPSAQERPLAELCMDEKLKEMILSDLGRLAKENKLKYFETLSNVHLHPEPFSVQNGLLTVTLKTRRPNVQKHFRAIIQSLYQVEKTTNSKP
jgi:long-chain acyl-CoA synthetase